MAARPCKTVGYTTNSNPNDAATALNILISMPPQQADKAAQWATAMQSRLPSATVSIDNGGEITQTVDYLLTWQPRADLLSQLTHARALFTASAGVDALLHDPNLPACPVIRLRDAGMGEQMADYALYACLHYARGFDRMRAEQTRCQWTPSAGATSRKPTAGVLGLGTLGCVVAKALVAHRFPVRGWSRRQRELDGVLSFAGSEQLPDFLAACDILICLLPLTPDTHHLMNANAFAQLPSGACVVNLARGDILVEADLLAALDSGHLRGAMLDVFAEEPLPSSHPFWHHPSVTVTPHIAAETLVEPGADQIARNIERLEQGKPAIGCVDRTAGY